MCSHSPDILYIWNQLGSSFWISQIPSLFYLSSLINIRFETTSTIPSHFTDSIIHSIAKIPVLVVSCPYWNKMECRSCYMSSLSFDRSDWCPSIPWAERVLWEVMMVCLGQHCIRNNSSFHSSSCQIKLTLFSVLFYWANFVVFIFFQ